MSVGVLFGGFSSMVRGVVQMTLRDQGMMRGGVVVANFMTSGGFTMVSRGVLVMFGGFVMMLNGLGGHKGSFVGKGVGR